MWNPPYLVTSDGLSTEGEMLVDSKVSIFFPLSGSVLSRLMPTDHYCDLLVLKLYVTLTRLGADRNPCETNFW
jgi:hypothetical protein